MMAPFDCIQNGKFDAKPQRAALISEVVTGGAYIVWP
jgi:hypothetical protein